MIKKLLAKPKILIISGITFILLCLFWFSLPSPLFRSPTSFVIEDNNGELLNAAIAKDGQWRFPVTDTIPDKFEKCITVYEDKRFKYHPGFDPLALLRAINLNLRHKKTLSGASTITMQVIRLSRNRPRTFLQKIIETLMAIRLELSYSKKEILALYAGNAPFGSNVVGLDAASWRYFGREPQELSWAETAMLAVLPNAPALVHPGKNRATLLKKRNALLSRLTKENIIDSNTARLAMLEPIPEQPIPLPQDAPHLLNRFKSDFASIKSETTKLKTTINGTLQKNISALLKRHHQQFKANGINNVAALVLDVTTGHSLAYVGNVYDPAHPELESHVDMINSLRSPGSTLKPLLYASMLNDGLILPHSLVQDIPTQIGGYTPQNHDLGYDGAIPASRALSRSLNIPAVKMLQQYKYERFHQLLKKTGITSLNKPADFYGLSMILGGCEVSMWELSGVYASMARTLNNYAKNPKYYNSYDYHPPTYAPKEKHPVVQLSASTIINYGSLFYTFQAMQEVMRPGEELLWEQFSSSQKIAWKTGTSFGFRDGWAIGLTPDHVVCVWVGNADGEGRPELTGIQTAAPVMFNIFDLLPASREFEIPYQDVVETTVCKQSGFRAGDDCLDTETTYLPDAAVKSVLCPYHKLIHLDLSGKHRVTSACEAPDKIKHVSWFVLPPAMEYYYKIRNRDYQTLPPISPACINEQENYRAMELIYPKNNAKVYIPLEIDGKRGKVIFNAAHRDAKSKIYWSVDQEYLGETSNFHEIAISPANGKHSITLVDDKGNRLVQVFEILDKKKGEK